MSNSRRLRRALAAAGVKPPESGQGRTGPSVAGFRIAHLKRWQAAAGSQRPTREDMARSEIHGAGPYRVTAVRPARARKHRGGRS